MLGWLWSRSLVYRALMAALEREREDHARTRQERDDFKRLWIEAVDGRLQNRPSVASPPERQGPPAEPTKMRRSRAEIENEFRVRSMAAWDAERREIELAALRAGENGQPNDVEGVQ